MISANELPLPLHILSAESPKNLETQLFLRT